MADTTAHGATLALGTSSWSQSIVAITPREQTRDSLDTTHLGTSGDFMTSKPADLADPGGVCLSGVTQETVAERMGTTKSAVSRLEGSARHAPSLATLRRYAEAVGCELEVRLVARK